MNNIELNLSDYITAYYENAFKPSYPDNEEILAELDDKAWENYRDEDF